MSYKLQLHKLQLYNWNSLCVWHIWWISLQFKSITLTQTGLVQCRENKTREVVLNVSVFLFSLYNLLVIWKSLENNFMLVMTIVHVNLIWSMNFCVLTQKYTFAFTHSYYFKFLFISVNFLIIKSLLCKVNIDNEGLLCTKTSAR